MSLKKTFNLSCFLLFCLFGFVTKVQAAEDFENLIKPLLVKSCNKCHGEKKVSGKINLQIVSSAKHLLEKPALIKDIIKVVEASDMPPLGEPELKEIDRLKLLVSLKTMLRSTTNSNELTQNQIRRLNRFQYNNAVKDLLQLKFDLFELPEKLMTRHDNYLMRPILKMPDKVQVESYALNPKSGLRGVKSFPKDLRAAHGFDNQANQLSLSPLLLDSFLRLSVSIVESPDFIEANVGIWNNFFKEPVSKNDTEAEVKTRLTPFLELAFRASVDVETLDRYTSYIVTKIKKGGTFTESMKKGVSAVLSSPRFLYRSQFAVDKDNSFHLASNLSFFLWASIPDQELLQLARTNELSKQEVLKKTIDRMLADPKIERFLDTFPSQWMQLENVLAATPDPQIYRYFKLDESNLASLQMVMEPLLLFDAVFLENRSITDFISPDFGYQSEFLKTWYTSNLKPPVIDLAKINLENNEIENQRTKLDSIIKITQAELDNLIEPVKAKLYANQETSNGKKIPPNLKPFAAWEFNGDLNDSIGSLHLESVGPVQFQNGFVVLDKAYLLSKKLPITLKAKTFEVWCKIHNLEQSGGGLMGIQGDGDIFDTIVLGERKQYHWISGSNNHKRTLDFPDSTPETKPNELLHFAMVYEENGSTTLYRNGKPYGKPYSNGAISFPKNKGSVIFGIRHLPAGGNKFLSVSLDKARLYDRALSASEVASSGSGILDAEILQGLSDEQKVKRLVLLQTISQAKELRNKIPLPRDSKKELQNVQRKFEDELRIKMNSHIFERIKASDPRYGGVITNAAVLSMTSSPKRTLPIARGAWVVEVIFNDPPPPPPNDIPPLNEEQTAGNLTIREKFAKHRENLTCAGCHARIDPLGFALENFDITGRWRDKYENGRAVDASGTLTRKQEFDGIVQFKELLMNEKKRFAKAFTAHLIRFALSRELSPIDSLVIEDIVNKTENDSFKLKDIIKEVILSDRFLETKSN